MRFKHLAMLAAAALPCLLLAADDKLAVSATIDFLDCTFVYKGPENHYPLEAYEQHIREMAQGGIRKIYLRVNICGLTHYPTSVSREYGHEHAFHWCYRDRALRLAETYRHYNPCLETIRLGHKYGMEVWGWESLYDDAGLKYSLQGMQPEDMDMYSQLDGWALLDPWYVENPDAFAAHISNINLQKKDMEAINRQARRKPIAKIVFANTERWANVAPSHATKENLSIYVSDDNANYRLYDKPYTFVKSTDPAMRNQFILSDLEIPEPYVKLHCSDNLYEKDEDITLILNDQEGQCHIYNSDGEEVPSCWTYCTGNPAKTSLNFRNGTPAGWDCFGRHIGFVVGTAITQEGDFHYGMAEFAVPKAMEHKVARFAEMAVYPFDGFMFNTRCHSARGNGRDFGYNPEVLAAFEKRHGHPFGGSDEDIQGVFQIRAEAIAEFFRRCKDISGGRPIYMSAPMPPEMSGEATYNDTFGPMPWPYRQMFREGSLDGVMMIGRNFRNGIDFSSYFTNEITGGKPIKIGIFRELGDDCPKDYDLQQELKTFRREGRLDEIELYESIRFMLNPEVFDVILDKAPDGYKVDWKPM